MLDAFSLGILEQYLNIQNLKKLSESGIPYWVNKYQSLFKYIINRNNHCTISEGYDLFEAILDKNQLLTFFYSLQNCYEIDKNIYDSKNIISNVRTSSNGLFLSKEGLIFSDGLNKHGETDVPEKYQGSFIACSTGSKHSLGLTKNGYIVAWGCNEDNQCSVPNEHQGSFISCSAKDNLSLGLTNNGKVIVWGKDYYEFGDFPSKYQGSIISICAGVYISAGVTFDGQIIMWDNALNFNNNYNVDKFNIICIFEKYNFNKLIYGPMLKLGQLAIIKCKHPNKFFIKCSISSSYYLGLTMDGDIYAWGNNENENCNVPDQYQGMFVDCLAGKYHSYGLTKYGELVIWGVNKYYKKYKNKDDSIPQELQGQFKVCI